MPIWHLSREGDGEKSNNGKNIKSSKIYVSPMIIVIFGIKKWVDSNNQYFKKNPFCTSSYKFYIKYGNKSCYFVVHSKLKPIEYEAFFKRK